MSVLGIVRHRDCLQHQTGDGHPESPARLAAVYAMLERAERVGSFVEIAARPAVEREILLVHSPEHLAAIAATAGRRHSALTPDTVASPGSYQAALLAAGGVVEAVIAAVAGKPSVSFALLRPPGHHAERNRAMGYCLFNNVAVGAAFAKSELGVKRVFIVDWDVHHGNGTQHIFERDPEVLFFSVHQYPHFPGSGVFTETGVGPGEGFTINVPLPGGYGDGEYAAIFEALIMRLAVEFEPGLILVSAGFDMLSADPLGKMRLTTRGLAAITRCLMESAARVCGGRMVLVLEGGYNPAALTDGVAAVMDELTDATVARPSEVAAHANPRKLEYALKRCVHVHGSRWQSLRQPLKIRVGGKTLAI
jgi:acetoin utilization deacetylase AcuC-like enzyme